MVSFSLVFGFGFRFLENETDKNNVEVQHVLQITTPNWLWHRQLLRHEKLRWVWRRIRVGRLCYYCVAPLETAFYLHKLFSELLFT